MKTFRRLPPGSEIVVVIMVAIALLGGVRLLSPEAGDRDPGSSAFLELASHSLVGTIGFVDYERAREIAGVRTPPPGAGSDVITEYLNALFEAGVMPISSPVSGLGAGQDTRSEIGFNIADVDQVLWSKSAVFARGRFDAVAIERAVLVTSSFSEAVEPASSGGLDFLAWENQQGTFIPSGVIIPGDEILIWSFSTERTRPVIHPAPSPAISMLRLPEFREVAAAFDELNVYAAYYEPFPADLSSDEARDLIWGEYGRTESGRRMLAAATPLLPFDGIVVGVGQRGDSGLAVMLLYHVAEADAVENASRLRTIVESESSFAAGVPWSERIDAFRIEARGRLVLATFESANLRLAIDAWLNLDSICCFIEEAS